jgi:signal transduction histidine kinase
MRNRLALREQAFRFRTPPVIRFIAHRMQSAGDPTMSSTGRSTRRLIQYPPAAARARSSARHIGSRNLSKRLPLPETDDESRRLTVTSNDMLWRLESSFYKIRQFTADASQELRTAVAVMRATAEVVGSKERTAEEHAKA